MGPLSDHQLSISPVFYVTLCDMWGPFKIFCPGYEKVTRTSKQKTYDAHFLVFACVATGMVNVQLVEKKDTGAVLDGCSRFFNETCVPKILLPDDA